ncbi:MAG: sugar transporter [Chloroflexi bacterium]|nr:sugar transporter [Chloroflexota bacterium]|tara:strand:- start:48 stop:1085 length:1038 start_codon:yes stop_codon:yes gene_type:complete
MRIIQYIMPSVGRRVGIIDNDKVSDITSIYPEIDSVYEIFQLSQKWDRDFNSTIDSLINNKSNKQPLLLDYNQLLGSKIGGLKPYLISPFDHPIKHKLLISGTGLTHTGSMQSRDQMHTNDNESDSAKMFNMGLRGGKPDKGKRGISPEWFYKGNGNILKFPGDELEVPGFALDGGEEPEVAACYFIDRNGNPKRVGFCLGNEWSDHETEKINYLYLAPSKLRSCSIGPELITNIEFDEIKIRCIVERDKKIIYDSGEIFSGEDYMSHSLANCEDHHFKYPLHRVPDDAHIHFFGTSKLSFSTRDWKYQKGDVVKVLSEQFYTPLINIVAEGADDQYGVFNVDQA